MTTGAKLVIRLPDGRWHHILLMHDGNCRTFVLSNMAAADGSEHPDALPQNFGFKYSWITGYIPDFPSAKVYFTDCWDATDVRFQLALCPKETL